MKGLAEHGLNFHCLLIVWQNTTVDVVLALLFVIAIGYHLPRTDHVYRWLYPYGFTVIWSRGCLRCFCGVLVWMLTR